MSATPRDARTCATCRHWHGSFLFDGTPSALPGTCTRIVDRLNNEPGGAFIDTEGAGKLHLRTRGTFGCTLYEVPYHG